VAGDCCGHESGCKVVVALSSIRYCAPLWCTALYAQHHWRLLTIRAATKPPPSWRDWRRWVGAMRARVLTCDSGKCGGQSRYGQRPDMGSPFGAWGTRGSSTPQRKRSHPSLAAHASDTQGIACRARRRIWIFFRRCSFTASVCSTRSFWFASLAAIDSIKTSHRLASVGKRLG
jgi:hypothetical protein